MVRDPPSWYWSSIYWQASYSLDAFHNVNENDAVPSRWVVKREIARQANEMRQQLGVTLKNAAKEGVLAISPDLWSDKFKQNSYLGLTAHFVDEHFAVHSIDLCCEPYNEINKRADCVRKVRSNCWSRSIPYPSFVHSSFFLFKGNTSCSLSLRTRRTDREGDLRVWSW